MVVERRVGVWVHRVLVLPLVSVHGIQTHLHFDACRMRITRTSSSREKVMIRKSSFHGFLAIGEIRWLGHTEVVSFVHGFLSIFGAWSHPHLLFIYYTVTIFTSTSNDTYSHMENLSLCLFLFFSSSSSNQQKKQVFPQFMVVI